jgi:hypothetical protein
MTEDSVGNGGVIAGQWLRRLGLEVKVDKGFAEGTYCVYVELCGGVNYVAPNGLPE